MAVLQVVVGRYDLQRPFLDGSRENRFLSGRVRATRLALQ